jgi:lipoprotein-anchoring transpeptidase ErfK/SrfK
MAEGRSGTAGCVALSNVDVEEVYRLLPVGTVVEIVP